MLRCTRSLFVLPFLGLGLLPLVVAAQSTDSSPASSNSSTDTSSSKWTFRIAPYLWGTAISGSVAHEGLPIEPHASMSFGDVWKHLDVGAMGSLEARKGKYGVLADGLLAKVSTTAYAPIGGAQLPIHLKSRTATGLIAFEYRAWENQASQIDLLAGLRYWSVRTRFSYAMPVAPPPPIPQQYSGEQEKGQYDLQLGIKGRHTFANRMYVGAWALAGKGDSKLSTDAMLLVGYEVNDKLSIGAGYRRISTDFSTAKGFKFKTTMQGPGLGLDYRF